MLTKGEKLLCVPLRFSFKNFSKPPTLNLHHTVCVRGDALVSITIESAVQRKTTVKKIPKKIIINKKQQRKEKEKWGREKEKEEISIICEMLNENEQSAATLYDNADRIPNGSLL